MLARMAAGSLRRFPVIGGIAAWHIPLVLTTLGLGAIGLGLLEIAMALAGLGFVVQSLLRGRVVEVSTRGLTRGLVLNGRFVGRTTVMAWIAVASVHTDWRRPGDDTALDTTVRDHQGHAIHFTTAMGLRAYWTCLAAVVAGARDAHRLGLTNAVLAADPLGRSTLLPAAATAGALALVIVALAGIHYLWAQGPSSLSRSIEQADAVGPAVRQPTIGTADPGQPR
ncbi:MAG: hypothetical protein ACRELZ_09155 [Candidatus Rokuibacteriota bacterium]